MLKTASDDDNDDVEAGPSEGPMNLEGLSGDALRSFIERIERLEETKAEITADIKDVYAEAKSSGFETKVMRKIVSMRQKDRQKLEEEDQLLELYRTAVGI